VITELDRREIEDAAARFPARRAAALEALQIIQKNHGWVSDEDLQGAAGILGLTPDELDGLASFYSMIFRKPVGRHVILVCDSICCWILGSDGIVDHLFDRLGIRWGETDPDGRFTLLPSPCLGACDHAPAMMVDGDLHGGLTSERIDAILEGYR